jgi:phosphatidylglycerol:prolipoprotein diacylglycerol transferase
MYPELFHIFGIPIRSYGVMLVLGFIIGAWIAQRRSAKYGVDKDRILDLAVLALFAGIIGGRVGFVLQDWKTYSHDLLSIFKIWEGGLTYFTGLLFGALAVYAYARKHKLAFLPLADLLAPSLAIGYAISRIGCFLNGCCYGGPCELPWAVQFHTSSGLTPPSHPTQLYGTAANLFLFGFLLWLDRRRGFTGQIFWAFLFLHGIYRFVDEIFRAGTTSTYLVGWLTDAQAAAVVLILFAGIGYVVSARRRPQKLPPASVVTPAS